MKILIRNARIVDAERNDPEVSDILIRNARIEKIGTRLQEAADQVIEAQGLTVIPGLVDMHCHLREPGYEHKETVATGSRAAAKGGYTTVCCMPNTKPVIDKAEALQSLLETIANDAVINVLPIAAVSIQQQSQSLVDMKALKSSGAVAFSDDGQPVSNNLLMREALQQAKEHQLLIIDHCEDHSLVNKGVINEGKKSQELKLPGISALSEELPIVRDIMLAHEVDYKLHIAHISTEGAAKIIKEAKDRGIRVTCEVTPHHIALSDDIITAGYTDCKVNPPLRSNRDREAMKQALKANVIDVIATDHAPHHHDDKGSDFFTAANGISGIETAFSVCYTELVEQGYLTLQELVAKMSLNPCKLLGLGQGKIVEGAIADIAIVDLNKSITVNREDFYSKGKNTPFHGRSYKGEVIYTIAEGKIVYSKEEKQ